MSYVTTALQRCQGRFSGDLQLGEVCVSSPPLICSSESSVECLCGIHYLQFSEYRLLDVVWQRCLPYKSIFHFDLHGLVKPKRGGGATGLPGQCSPSAQPLWCPILETFISILGIDCLILNQS